MKAYKAEAPTFESFNVGNKIIISKELRQALDAYSCADVEPTLQNITERQAQAVAVLTELSRAYIEHV